MGGMRSYWTDWEIAVLRQNYGKMPLASLSARLGKNVKQIQAKALSLNMRRRPAGKS